MFTGIIVFLIVLSLCLFLSVADSKNGSNAEKITKYICNQKIEREKIRAEKEITITKMQLDNEIRLRKWLDEPLKVENKNND